MLWGLAVPCSLQWIMFGVLLSMVPRSGSPAVNGAAVVSSWILFGGSPSMIPGMVWAWISPAVNGAAVAWSVLLESVAVDSWAVAVALSFVERTTRQRKSNEQTIVCMGLALALAWISPAGNRAAVLSMIQA